MKAYPHDTLGDPSSPIHNLDARSKILGFFSVIVLSVSMPNESWQILASFPVLVILVAGIARIQPGHLAWRSLVIFPFVLVVAAAAPFMGVEQSSILGLQTIWPPRIQPESWILVRGVLLKGSTAVISTIVLISTTRFPALVDGFERLLVPRLLVSTAAMSYRYFFVLRDEALRIRTAAEMRGYGARWLLEAKTIGNIVGVLLLRGFEKGEGVYQAMLARGYGAQRTVAARRSLTVLDWIFLVLMTGSATTLRILA